MSSGEGKGDPHGSENGDSSPLAEEANASHQSGEEAQTVHADQSDNDSLDSLLNGGDEEDIPHAREEGNSPIIFDADDPYLAGASEDDFDTDDDSMGVGGYYDYEDYVNVPGAALDMDGAYSTLVLNSDLADTRSGWLVSSESSQSAAENMSETSITYDRSRTAEHEYLGHGDPVGSQPLLPIGEKISLFVIPLDNVVIYPEQTVPLRFVQANGLATVRALLDKGTKVFGVLNTSGLGVSLHGTTVAVQSMTSLEDGSLNILAKGRQRFKLINQNTAWHGPTMTSIEVLPDRNLPSPPLATVLCKQILQDAAKEGERERCTHNTKSIVPFRKGGRRHPRAEEAVGKPQWLHRLYCETTLKTRALQLYGSVFGLGSTPPPCDATSFSYWLAGNLCLSDSKKVELLKMSSAVERLQRELVELSKPMVLHCYCSSEISSARNVFSMSVEGPQQVYVNTYGYVHEMITIKKAQNLFAIGQPTTQESWFPGYAWALAYCESCRIHLGWRFTSTQPNLSPRSFWGLRRAALF